MSFNSLNLHENILKAIEHCGYTDPTPVQEKAIPVALEGKDIVASAQTGTGKTAAFVLPALHRLSIQPASKKTRILILTPTRELAAQITKAATEYGKFLRFNIVNLVGGMPYHQQIRELARGADIIVATPGRLLDHIENKRVQLSDIEMLVLDEADRMLDMGFIEDVEYIASLTPPRRQTLLFSATVDKQLTTVVRHLLKNPVRIDLSSEKITVSRIEQQLYKADSPQQKARLLKHFLNDKNVFKAIIFSATKINAEKIATRLREDGFAAGSLHGDLRQNVRNRTIEQLRRGKIQFLVATDVAARGIDISDVTHVFNYDMPRFCEDYVHRIGRTGRAGKNGVAISFVLPTDLRHLQRIERYIGQRLTLIKNFNVPHNDSAAIQPEFKEDAHEPREHTRESRGPQRERRERGHESRSSDREHNERGYESRNKSREPREQRTRESRGPQRERRERGSSESGSRSFEPREQRTRESRGPQRERRERGSSESGSRSYEPREQRTRESRGPQRERRERGSESASRSYEPREQRTRESRGPQRERRERSHESRTGSPEPRRGRSYESKEPRFGKSKERSTSHDGESKGRFNPKDKPRRPAKAANDGNRPFKKRFVNKDRWQGEKRVRSE